MKKFVTIFPACENVHLVKDVGQIPLFMRTRAGFDASIVCYENASYEHLANEAKGLALEFIPDHKRISFCERAVITYLQRNARSIDVLNLYHYSKQSFVYALLYKHYHPRGKVFLKADAYNETFASGSRVRFSRKPVKNLAIAHLEKRFLKKVDLISIETKEGERLLKAKFPALAEKILYLPVGVNDIFLRSAFSGKFLSFAEKENIILTTGRIGEPVKNHEMLLRALAGVDLRSWRVVFVGPVNKQFQLYVDRFLHEHPRLKDKIEFTGAISDRKQLYEWYNRSKVVCMTSLRESFCHTLVEGLYFGNFLLGTEGIMSMDDLTSGEMFGRIVPVDDDARLANQIDAIVKEEIDLAALYPKIIDHARKNFAWSKIIGSLSEKLLK